jgi:hypothetical protein
MGLDYTEGQERVLARIIHEGFYCNRRHAAPTGLTAGGLATQSVNILFKYASLPRASARPSRVASRRFRPSTGLGTLS